MMVRITKIPDNEEIDDPEDNNEEDENDGEV